MERSHGSQGFLVIVIALFPGSSGREGRGGGGGKEGGIAWE